MNGVGFATHDSAAGGGGQDEGHGVAIDNLGRIVVTGFGENANGPDNRDMAVWRYTDSGVLDTSFNGTGFVVDDSATGGDFEDHGYAITLDAQGRIVVAGDSTGNALDMAIWRINP